MFARRTSVQRIDESSARQPCPIRRIDNFAMRNFTNDSIFDDTLPAGDGLLEAGHRVPLDRLRTAIEDWFRRKGYLRPEKRLEVTARDAAGFTTWGSGRGYLVRRRGPELELGLATGFRPGLSLPSAWSQRSNCSRAAW
jgi:hypothetical protein